MGEPNGATKVAKVTATRSTTRAPERLAAAQEVAGIPSAGFQESAGNLAVQALLRDSAVGPKLSVSQPHDPDERSADAIADRALAGEAPAGQAAPIVAAGPAPAPGPAVAAALDGDAGAPLPSVEQAEFGTKLGADLSGVRIHDDEAAHAAAKEIGARAFTHGRDIFFAAGEWRPEDREGRRLLAHELAHTVQQVPPDLLLRERDVIADFSQRPQYPVATTPVRPPGTIVFTSDTGEASYVPYVIYRPEDIPSFLYDLHTKSSQAIRIRNPGAGFGTIYDILSGQIPFPDPDRISIRDTINYARTEGSGFDLRVLIGFVDGGFRFLGYDMSQTGSGSVGSGFVESSPATGAIGRVLFANRVTRTLARGIAEMHLEVGYSGRTEEFHVQIRRIAGIAGDPGQGDTYALNTQQMARIALAWSDVLSPAERQGLAEVAAQQEPPTPQAAQAVFAGRVPGGAEPPAADVPAAGPAPAAATGETMAMMERFRAQLRGNIRRPAEVGKIRELTDPDVQARVLSQSFGFAIAEGRLYRLERVGQGIRISEVVPEPIVQPIAAPGPLAPFEPPIIEPQIINLDPDRAIRIGENVIPPNQTVAGFKPGEFIVGYSPNQLVAVDPRTGHPLLGVYEGGQWYELLDPNNPNTPLDFDPVTGARIVNLGTAGTPIPAMEIDTYLGPPQTTFQRAPVSTIGIGVGGVIMVANELLKWVGATLDVQRATIASGTAEIDLWTRLNAAPVAGIWDANRMAPASPGADAQTGVVFASYRFPYVADINAARLRTELPTRVKTYAELAVLIASLGKLEALTQDRGRWIVKVNRPQGAVHKTYDITEAMNTVEALSLATADVTLRERLAARPQAGRGRILHIKQGATLYRSESESWFELRRQPLTGGPGLGPNAWVREIRSGRHGKLFVEPVNADAYQAVALTRYMILREITDVWRECKEGGREVIPAELPSFGDGPLTSFQAGPETTGEQRFGWTRYIVRPDDPNLAVTAKSTIAFGELRAFWVSEDDTTVVADEAVASFLRQ